MTKNSQSTCVSEPLPVIGKLPRRRFLGGAAAATLVVGIGETLRPQKVNALAAGGILSVALWDGTSLAAAPAAGAASRSVVSRDAAALTRRVQVTISAPTCTNAYGESASAAALQAVNAYFAVAAESKTGSVSRLPFYAWIAAPQGRPAVSFPMPLDAAGGITLAVESGAGETPCRLTTGGEKGAITLREGTYVIAVGCEPAWLLCGFDPTENASAPVTQRTRRGPARAAFDSVVVKIVFIDDSAAADASAPIAV